MLLSSHRGGARVGADPLPEQTDRRKSTPGTNRRARQLTSHTHAGSTAPTLPASPGPATTNTYRRFTAAEIPLLRPLIVRTVVAMGTHAIVIRFRRR